MTEPPMQTQPGDVFHVQRDEAYLRQLHDEEDFWDRPHRFCLDVGTKIPLISRYLNERFTGNRDLPWYGTIPSHGTFRKGCVLGGGAIPAEAEVLSQNQSLHLTFFEISAEALARREEQLGRRFPGRVELRDQDLNFVELPEASYDFVLSNSCMHHLLNLEHVAAQVDRALTPDGRFFLHDYVGESRFQFSPEKKRIFESFLEEARPRKPELRQWRTVWPDTNDWQAYSPFEAIRSEETLDVLSRYLVEESVRTAGALFPLALFLRPTDEAAAQRSLPRGRLGRLADRLGRGWPLRRRGGLAGLIEQLASDLVREDRLLSEAGTVRPGMAFAVYRKRGSAG